MFGQIVGRICVAASRWAFGSPIGPIDFAMPASNRHCRESGLRFYFGEAESPETPARRTKKFPVRYSDTADRASAETTEDRFYSDSLEPTFPRKREPRGFSVMLG